MEGEAQGVQHLRYPYLRGPGLLCATDWAVCGAQAWGGPGSAGLCPHVHPGAPSSVDQTDKEEIPNFNEYFQ